MRRDEARHDLGMTLGTGLVQGSPAIIIGRIGFRAMLEESVYDSERADSGRKVQKGFVMIIVPQSRVGFLGQQLLHSLEIVALDRLDQFRPDMIFQVRLGFFIGIGLARRRSSSLALLRIPEIDRRHGSRPANVFPGLG